LEIPKITLEGKSVFITGASHGIGQAFALACAGYGAEVAAFARGPLDETADLVKTKTGKDILAIRGDVLNLSQVKGAVDRAAERFGKLDVLVNNAGILHMAPITDMTEEAFDRLIGVNLKGVYFACKFAAEHMIPRRSGVIVNIGSEVSFTGAARLSAYAATKGAVFILSQSLAVELGPYGIRVVTLSPGPTRTPMHRENLKDPAFKQAVESKGVLGRMNEPEDVAGALVLIASDAARMVTGTNWSVDGGCLAK
jgi:NAD(P)-dependent dehydrogenase (short-subunit alcohol dehydrogenase family)